MGSQTISISSNIIVNDGNWHSVMFMKEKETTKLIIDRVIEKKETEKNTTIFIETPYYFGGVNPTLKESMESVS